LSTALVGDFFGLHSELKSRVMNGVALEIALELSSRGRLRMTIYRMQVGLAAAIRLLPPITPQLSELNMPVPLQGLAELPHGLVLLCGSTGSGKSTTLAALCRHALEHRSVMLVTLEDPIEFVLPATNQSIVRQRQIGRDVADFTTGLRDALRSDPDVIMVGELRDAETIRLALTAAETGHLVLASLHSGSAAACVERVIDAYPADQRTQIRIQLADALRAVVVQKLLPRAHGAGRVPALEVLRVTHGVANVIREGKTAQIGTMLQAGKRDGMISLEHCLSDYVKAGVIATEQSGANGFLKQEPGKPAHEAGVSSIRGELGHYWLPFRTDATAFWGLDADGHLIDVSV
jgi:twitching motility protein PilT